MLGQILGVHLTDEAGTKLGKIDHVELLLAVLLLEVNLEFLERVILGFRHELHEEDDRDEVDAPEHEVGPASSEVRDHCWKHEGDDGVDSTSASSSASVGMPSFDSSSARIVLLCMRPKRSLF